MSQTLSLPLSSSLAKWHLDLETPEMVEQGEWKKERGRAERDLEKMSAEVVEDLGQLVLSPQRLHKGI